MSNEIMPLHAKNIDEAMLLFQSQGILFSNKPSRLALINLALPRPIGHRVVVNVWRNHAFEPIEPIVVPYFQFRGLSVDFRISGYDDSLSFIEHGIASAELLWLDSRRFLARMDFNEWLGWLEERIRLLRRISKAPIIIATWIEDREQRRRVQDFSDSLPAVYFAELYSTCEAAGVNLLDERSASFAGTPLSSAAQTILARILACQWLPGAILPPIKALALDLDHTLHAGVLGEDGVQGVQLTAGHRDLQQFIKSLQERGIFIALVSRNERSDVGVLFSERKDYPLRWSDFSAIEVSWGEKSAAIERIAKALRISTDSILFVDDNPGELASVLQQLPQVHTLHANVDAKLTLQAINFYPGLWRWKVEVDDTKRVNDLKANVERQAIAESISDPTEYFRSLQVKLSFRNSPQEQLARLADLCKKTNQFNLAIRRFNEVELAERLVKSDSAVASVHLSDRLSDSGVIAVLVAERCGSRLVVEEVCVSCRAMGRQLEDSIIICALRTMPIFYGCEEVVFRVEHGPRNQPALNWLKKLLCAEEMPSAGLHSLPSLSLQVFKPADGVIIFQH